MPISHLGGTHDAPTEDPAGEAGSARTELMPLAPRTEALAASEPGRAASELEGAAVTTEAEGLRLHLSNSNSTGYRGVHKHSGRFRAQHRVNGRIVYLGYFDTAVEAAVAYARSVGEYQPPTQPPPSVAAEAEGVRLHLSSSSSTGYLGVWEEASGRFRAQHRVDGMHAGLGSFHTAVEAAVAVARAISEASAVATSAPESAPPSELADETICARTQERGSGAIGCVLPAGHAGPHSFTLQGKRARCVKCPFDPTDVEAEESGECASTQAGDDSESEVEATAGMAAPAGSEATSSQEAPVAEAESLRLHPSSCSSSTGYKGVFKQASGRFLAERRLDGRRVSLGTFDSAVEAAVAYARAVGEYQPPTVAAEAEGMRLHLSSSNNTGYRGVCELAYGRFRAQHRVDGRQDVLGYFDTAVEAAASYARAVVEAAVPGEAAAAAGEASDSGEGEPGGAGGEAAAAESSGTGEAASCLWVACDRCDKWRRLPSSMPGQLPAEWLCWMHPDPACRVCEASEEELGLGRAQAERQAAAVVAEAEGLRLHLSSSSTGYKGVYEQSGRFQAKHRVDGRLAHLGTFDTAVEAAVAYARAVGEYQPPTVAAAEAEGLQLHLSSSNATGYKGVFKDGARFKAQHRVDGRMVFDTAVEAAVAYARAVGQAAAAGVAGSSAAAAGEASGSGEGEQGGAGGEAADAEGSSDEEEAASCLWVACDRCDKWRRLPSGMPGSLTAEWFCWMHPPQSA
ncbi:hypothetical protein EMIHUDRAFT_101766 [Emiliania huxleyi CCMP1516]|uniref:AP2/ERF domain-containing protein n=2 Tax=Emiliania huxleyi TaxID=2903 RepID=A0A0D3JC38_EMIH1|nr:hypothetical protein EMIHUDRAFT_101766 [Emiliania huxleyi CCMP1516]EOD21073.1 hypothetical protein EMIHUDRAFT_101766 [Emiliania huxleyi CCMP1516]|eukprot:XP_005773502.1 hypothetical protein EMIHUDRAFT_101766 [Emiliania huxleyi CCMP1516]